MVGLVVLVVLNIIYTALGSCPSGWVEHENSCYHFSRDSASYPEATKLCEMHNSRLANIETSLENSFLITSLRAKPNGIGAWVGGSDWSVEGQWVWEPLGQAFTFTDWVQGQPDNGHGGSEHCLLMAHNDHYHWHDARCYLNAHYICEKGANVDSTTTSAPMETSSLVVGL